MTYIVKLTLLEGYLDIKIYLYENRVTLVL